MWSLAVEVSWYLVLPAVGTILSRYAQRNRSRSKNDVDRVARRLLYGIAVLAAIPFFYEALIIDSPSAPLLANWLPRYLGWFAAGMAIAVVSAWAQLEPASYIARACRTIGASWGSCWLIAALLYCVASTPITGASRQYSGTLWTSQFMIGLYGLVALFLLAPAALAPQPTVNALLGNRIMRFLGKISYGIFLWQFIVVFAWFDLTGQHYFTGRVTLEFPVLALLSIVIATLSYYLIEKPLRQLFSLTR
jgi:peptidoglycan/LPS O-acetylase OafA/YrhL